MTAPAFRIDGERASREAFYAAACDPARSCAVEACAGSGKTWMLVSRMLRALLDGAAPHEILAITFTRAAAGEMRQRLNEWLASYSTPRSTHAQRVAALVERGVAAARAETLAPLLGELHGRVLAAGRPIEIRTFHAWFSQLLRATPLALLDRLGLAPEMELIEDLDDHRPAVMRAFYAAVLRDAALHDDYSALTAERGRYQLRRWLDAGWRRRVEFELADEAGVLDDSVVTAATQWPELAGFAHPSKVLGGKAWHERLRTLAIELGLGGKAAQEAATGLVVALDAADPSQRFELAWKALFTKGDTPRVLGRGSASLSEVQQALEHVAAQIQQHDARIEHLRMVRLTRALLVAFADYKRARGYADMADLERCALALLRDNELSGWVQERLDARIRHLLIDEFQDTSPLQWHALHAWLDGYTGAGGGASGQKPPGVFLVGDPKQSIYRFRGAEPRVFAAATRFIREGLDGTVLACDHTRRNAPGVIAAINALFTAAVEDGSFSEFRPHTTELVPEAGGTVEVLPRTARDPKAARPDLSRLPVWRDSLTVPRLEPEIVLREREAAAVAIAIGTAIADGASPGEVFVLCRKRETLRLVATALQREHIAHSAVEDTALASTPEAQDLIAVLDAIVSPAHRLSLARALRSPVFGASDADLLELSAAALAGEHRDWWRALGALASPSPALSRARVLLQRWRLLAESLPPHDLLDRIVHEGEVRERTVAVVPAAQRALALDAIDAVLAQALLLDGGRYATPYGFVRALKRRTVKSPPPVHADAVRLLTIHGAKGLEAECVFVTDADPERQATETTTLLVEWPVEAERPTHCAFIYSESRCPASLQPLLEGEMHAREREELNGLYVAMTRAKRRLVFSATEPFLAPLAKTWWQRVAPFAIVDVPLAAGVAKVVSPRPAAERGAATLKVLPQRTRVATSTTAQKLDPLPAAAQPDDGWQAGAAPLGRAVHRVLEWVAQASNASSIEALALAAAREFGVAAAPVLQHALAIFEHPEGARFFSGPQILWSGNEVAVSVAGEVRRIDRLVHVDEGDSAVWWVLDYKLRHDPQALAPYRQQLLGYREAVRAAQPGHAVRCAFITGDGRVVEIA
jgi:ATP-dependent helicase/nuclease subunit A